MNGAVLAVSPRPDLLDRRGQSGRAVGDDQARRRESPGGEITAELEPVFFGLSHPNRTETSSLAPVSVIPQAQITPSFGPLGRTGR